MARIESSHAKPNVQEVLQPVSGWEISLFKMAPAGGILEVVDDGGWKPAARKWLDRFVAGENSIYRHPLQLGDDYMVGVGEVGHQLWIAFLRKRP